MVGVFNHQDIRTRKARLATKFTKIVRYSIMFIVGLLLIGGILLLIGGTSLGWFILLLSAWPVMILRWYDGHLSDLPAGISGQLHDILEGDILAAMPDNPTPKQIAAAAMKARSGQFFVARFGIAPDFLLNLSSDNPNDSALVIEQAINLKNAMNSPLIWGGMLVAALCETQPQLKALLPHLQIDERDLEIGARWYSRLLEMIENNKKPKRTGGIARDWSFGYANLLNRFGANISQQVAHRGAQSVHLSSHQNALQYLNDTFSSGGRQNVALIGPVGSGKTTVVKAFAESLLSANSKLSPNLRFRQVISLDASSIISAAHSRNELEGLVNRLLVEAYKAKNIILCLDDAQLFFEDVPGSVDLSSILLPVLEGGGLRMILTMDEQRYLQISQRNPALASALNRASIGSATETESLLVMQDELITIEFQRNVTFMYQALKEAYRLSERYLYELAQPGKSVRLLEQAASHAENGVVTAASVALAIENSSGVKVARVDTGEERDKLLKLEELIHQRMINQTRAVSVVSDALRRARAGVRNENRPIGTFLFLGPTGVGKTELAKSLAAIYFGGEDRIARIDMNEYVRPEDVARLIADGANDPHSLTASIMKQPFSVVLLDEIEKAHPQVLTTLLQLLDEGILRDINNREVSFRDAIIIATSNAGADRIREMITAGHSLEASEEQLVNELIDSNQFRPEFLNRFDEIVVFRPLTQDELVQVVQLNIASINKTLAPQKVSVQLTQEAAVKLASIGYDPRLGARPMRRVVQRSVENLIARRMLEGNVSPGDVIQITVDDINL